MGAESSGGTLRVWIEDDGDGLSDTESIFERYTTGEGTSASLGMGLYLCRKIMEMHGGTIRAEKSEEL
ncbi:MAG: ATP-binding protein [Patescibacteria group bacterium]